MSAPESTNPAVSPSEATDESPSLDLAQIQMQSVSLTRAADRKEAAPISPNSSKNFTDEHGADILLGMGLALFLLAVFVLIARHWVPAAVCGGVGLFTVVVAIRVKDFQSVDVELGRLIKMRLKVLLGSGKPEDDEARR